jgi:hypothetical protein
LEKKVNGVFKPVLYPFSLMTYWGTFHRLEQANEPSPNNPFKIRVHSAQRGEITYSIPIDLPVDSSPGYIQPGDTLRGRVQIADRARNLSNTIETPEFVYLK